MSEIVEAEEARDALALSGLRRMVLHARNQLRSTTVQPSWHYDRDAWSPEQVKRHAATALAEQVLTLVAECIPGGGTISVDEAEANVRALKTAAQQQARERDAATAALQEQVTKLQGQVELVARERNEAREQWEIYEGAEAELLDKMERLAKLAKTDVPAAIKLLLDDENDPGGDTDR